ncbi:MAG: PKD domain-containing protein, partial [Candidatus Cloacimonadales bacterium]|nr:PKD domain-containing protein [Candidatus Cloacimonadales bacterium]
LSGPVALNVNFTDLSSGNITTWEWDFDNDGTIDSNEQNPTYLYDEVGVYSVSLTVGDGSTTATETKVDYITVDPSLIADFSAVPLTGLAPLEVQFTDATIGTPTTWEWDFDNDGTIDSNEQNPLYTYTVAGDYSVSLTVSDAYYSTTETKIDYISVGDQIIADFSADPLLGLVPLAVQFTDSSVGAINSWEWDFDNDGTIDSSEQDPSYIYTSAGTFTVVLTVGDGTYFDTETKVDYITVVPEIIADFSAVPLSGSAPLQVQFTDNSAGDLNSWEWDFDNDGTIDSSEQDPSYMYTSAGTFTVVLTVGDGTFFDTETKVDYIEVTGVGTGGELIPNFTSLSQNYPNPFNPSTTISLNVQEGKEATLMIFNIKGQLLETNVFSSGNHNFEWNAQTSGIYFYKLISGDFSETRKMILLK